NNVTWKNQVHDLSLAVAEKLVTSGEATLDEAKFAIFVAVNNQVSPLAYRTFKLDQPPQALQICIAQFNVALEPDDKRVLPQSVGARAETVHVSGPVLIGKRTVLLILSNNPD